MSYENPLDPNIFVQMEHLDYIYTYKQQATDKTTNNPTIENNRHQFHNAFQNSPLRSSFFFTPNSPKPILYECINDQANRRFNKNLISYINTGPSISKKLNLEDEELDQMNQQDNSSSIIFKLQRNPPNRSHKNAKGLKNLSQSVYMIVSELSITKYKQVADRLVNQISMEKHLQNEVNKDQHNIKRRVYDALNVLIAAGLLRKEGKQVACNEPYRKSKSNRKKNLKQLRQINKLQEQTNKRILEFQQKQQRYLKLQQKKNLIQYIIKRNKATKQTSKILKFPIISLMVDNNSLKTYNISSDNFIIKMKEKTTIYGDVDLLLSINKDSIQMDNLLNNICCEIKLEETIRQVKHQN